MADTEALTDEEILAELVTLADTITRHEEFLDGFYARRLHLYQMGQAEDRDPKISQMRLAAAAGVSDVAVSVALTKARKAAAVTADG